MTAPPDTPAGARLPLLAAIVLACAALLKAGAAIVPFPHWDADPFVVGGPLMAWGPTASLVLDLACCAASALALGIAPRTGRAAIALLVIGSAGVLVHSLRSVEHLAVGSAWVGAMSAGVAAWHLAADARARRVLLAAALGFTMMLAARGAQQVFIEHPVTLEHFEANREAFYQSRGWTPGSRSAMVYERRLRQPAATGWFGLSNVVATFAAGGLVAMAGLAAAGWRRGSRAAAPLLAAGALACAATLAMTASKGGWGAAVIGAAVLGVGWAASRLGPPRRALPWLTLGVPIGVVALVLARGVLGERLGELSLLFRAFYLEGAARIFADHSLLGVGPDGFKEAYLLARPPLSPEEVSSPHALLADWAATLGVFGLAWCGLLLWSAWKAGAPRPTPTDQLPPLGPEVKGAALVAVGVTIASAFLERPAATIDASLIRLAGLAAWIGLGWAVLVVMRAGRVGLVVPALGAGAVALLAHAQLDLAGTHAGSAPLLMLLIGALVAPPGGIGARKARIGASAVVAVLGAVMAAIGLPPVARWEAALHDAAAPALALKAATEEMRAAGSDAEALVLARAFAARAGIPPPETPSGVPLMLGFARARALGSAADGLGRALDARPDHHGTLVALCRVELARMGDDPTAAGRALALAEAAADRRPRSASAWMWLGSLRAGVADAPGVEAGRAESLRRGAIQAWEVAAGLDPRGPDAPARLMAMSERLGEGQAARTWARRALVADEGMRLDPLKRLSEGERAAAERLAGGVAGGASEP